MGNLINPISLRLGWTYNWEDDYFVEPIYYPEYLHIVFKIKLYLVYFFNSAAFENKLAIFYSHFDVIKVYKNLIARIFLYHGKVESLVSDFYYDNFKEIKKDKIICGLLSRRRAYLDFGHIETFMLLLVFKFFATFYWKEWPLTFIRKFINILEAADLSALRVMLKKPPYCNMNKNLRTSLIYFCSIYIYLFNIGDEDDILDNFSDVIRQFLFGLFWINCFNVVFKNIAKWLSSIFSFIFGLNHIITKIYIISNDDVTAKFISRFMARKYDQGSAVMDMINPLTKELKTVVENLRDYSVKAALKDSKSGGFLMYYRGIFKNFLMIMYSAFAQEIYKFYKNKYIWLTFEFLILKIQNIKKFKNIKILIGLSKKLVKNKIGFFLFFNTKFIFFKKLIFNTVLAWNSFFLRSVIDFYDFYNHVIEELDTLNYVFFWNSNIQINAGIIQRYLVNLNRFIKNAYFNFNFLYNVSFLNKRKMRAAISTKIKNLKGEGILGFKFQIKGRFSRRQKVSSVYFKHGLMPVNTISANIEYAYYVIPIENSATIVKVWIYRNNNYFTNWFLKIV
jgi:hypothetical protein